jgi:hypothetical protein
MSFTWRPQLTTGTAGRAPRRGRPNRAGQGRSHLAVELLETRTLPSVAVPTFVLHHNGIGPGTAPGYPGYAPSQIQHAYGFDQIKFGSATGDGTGTTIAIVDAYDDPNLVSDLHQFDLAFGIADPVLTRVNEFGGSSLPAGDPGWAEEISLDVEWSHAIAPAAKILLVEATSATFNDLLNAVDYAASAPGVVVVSMSWGGGEFSGESAYDSHFTTPTGHTGVTFVASSGDNGAPPIWPAVSKNVLAVGGTSLYLNPSNVIYSEVGWPGSGGGISSDEAQPSYQQGVVSQTSTARANPDVAYDADPNTGFQVYDTYQTGGTWGEVGGTSAGAPQWAALIAIADQGRAAKGSLDGATQTLPTLYGLSSSDYHDITQGTSYGTPWYSAGPGYDLVTGLGSPVANLIVNDLGGTTGGGGGGTGAPKATHFSITASPTTINAGGTTSLTVTALDSSNNTVTGYSGTVHFTSTDPNATLPADYPFTATDNGKHTFTGVKLTKAGSQTITATDTGNSSLTGTVTVTVNPGTAHQLVFGQQPTSAPVNAVISPAVTVKILDNYGNLLTADNTDQVGLAFGANPTQATLGGTTTVTVSGGVATFKTLTVNKPGTGYTLVASSGTLATVTSSPFNVAAASASSIIEDFESSTALSRYTVVGPSAPNFYRYAPAHHDGSYGMVDMAAGDWAYRNDPAATVRQGDSLSVWLQMYGAADGRSYFGFGAGPGGTLSLVAAGNTGQLILQSNLGYGFQDLAASSASYLPYHWYRLDVEWGTGGAITGKLYDSDGKTLLTSVSAQTNVITSGGIAFRAFGNAKFWDTVTDSPGGAQPHDRVRVDPTGGAADGNLASNLPAGETGTAHQPTTTLVVDTAAPIRAMQTTAIAVTAPAVATASPAVDILFLAPRSNQANAALGNGGAGVADSVGVVSVAESPATDAMEDRWGTSPAIGSADAGGDRAGDTADQAPAWVRISEAYFAAQAKVDPDRDGVAALPNRQEPRATPEKLAAAAALGAALGLVWTPAWDGRRRERRRAAWEGEAE